MKTIFVGKNLKKSLKRTAVTIGVFDGVHIGHRLVIKKTIQEARRIRGKSVVVTFDPHPLYILHPKQRPPRIMSLPHKLRIFKELGADICIVIKFNERFSALDPKKFIKDMLVDKLGVSTILIGENFLFGKARKGSLPTLKALSKRYDFSIKPVKAVRVSKTMISSTLIRQLISRGDLSRAARLLGRPVSVLGTVVKGDRRGRIIGYPTANIDPHHEVIPPSGVYAVKIRLQNKLFSGILNLGRCPTFKPKKNVEPTIEVHIFNFNKDIYGEDLDILFIKKIREERYFLSREVLAGQIRKDEKKARKIFTRR